MSKAILSLTSGLVLALLAGHAAGQANFPESFQNIGDGSAGSGGPAPLVNRGWVFRNQSRPAGTGVSPYWTEFGSGWVNLDPAVGMVDL